MFKAFMPKQKLKFIDRARQSAGLGLVSLILVGATLYGGLIHADQFDEQIRSLQAQNAANRANSNSLAAQASSYQDTIDKLQAQIDSLQVAINDNEAKITDLQNQIDQAQAELNRQKQVLGENILTMYLEGQISTIEMLASSKNLSDFVDKQQYHNSVQNKIRDTLDRINKLKLQLQEQQTQLQSRNKDLEVQRSQISSSQSQQQQLLAYTTTQKASFDSQIKTNNSQIAALRAAQAAANRKLSGGANVIPGDPNHGGYPAFWNNAPEDSLLDNWGMLNRECVSYTAWKVYDTYGYMPYWGGVGNANQWPGDAEAAGIPTGSTPRVGSVAISMAGYYGHAMWVEAVEGNMIHVSQYNFDLAGHYSEMTINGAGLIYIYFQ